MRWMLSGGRACFGEALIAAVRTAGFKPDSFLPEYGPRQYEATVAAEQGMRAADAAVVLRELARAIAWRTGQRAIFAPMLAPDGIGSGTHIHLSLWDGETPVTHDADADHGISERVAPFFAGVLAHLPAICAFSAPSVAWYLVSLRTAGHRCMPISERRTGGRRYASRLCSKLRRSNQRDSSTWSPASRMGRTARISRWVQSCGLAWMDLRGGSSCRRPAPKRHCCRARSRRP